MAPVPPKNTLVTYAARELSQMILKGEFSPGQFLPPQKDLAGQLGVGASTLREAIQGLVAMGVLESHSGKGTWVRRDALENLATPAALKARLTSLHAGMVLETRAVIEVSITELAAQRATPADVERIRSALNAMIAAVDDDDAFVKADLEFHSGVAEASHNELLIQFYHLARKLLAEVIAELVKLPSVKQDAIAVQTAIVQAIERHDADEARIEAVKHMNDVARLLEFVEQAGGR